MKPEVFQLLMALSAGMLLGFAYMAGLWFTVQRLGTASHPLLLISGSFLLRLSISLTGFFLVMGGHWERLIMCLLGFLIIRSLLVKRWGHAGSSVTSVRNFLS